MKAIMLIFALYGDIPPTVVEFDNIESCELSAKNISIRLKEIRINHKFVTSCYYK